MMDFEIKKGKSTSLFNEAGECILPSEHLSDGCWYLTTDTAEVYVAFQQPDGTFQLRKLNECDVDVDFDLEDFDNRLSALEAQERIHTYGYKNLFPVNATEGDVYVAADEGCTYVFYNGRYCLVGSSDSAPEIIFGGTAD